MKKKLEALGHLYPMVIENKTVADLPAPLFRRLIQLCCIAGRNGGILPYVDEVAWTLRISGNELRQDLAELSQYGLVVTEDGQYRPTGLGEVVKAKLTKVFVKPTPEEVTDYAKTIGFVLDGRAFCDFYESRGWRYGNTPIKDWKAAVRTWKRRRIEEGQKPAAPPPPRRGPVDLKGE